MCECNANYISVTRRDIEMNKCTKNTIYLLHALSEVIVSFKLPLMTSPSKSILATNNHPEPNSLCTA